MKKSILFLFFGLLFPLHASTNTCVDSLLWQVTKAGEPTSYLLGTVHLGKKDAKLSPPIETRLARSQVLVTETTLSPSQATILSLKEKMMDDTKSLKQRLGESDFAQLIQHLGENAPATSVIDHMRPWAALSLIIYHKPEGYSEDYGVEMQLQKRALELNLDFDALEPLEKSVNYLMAIPEAMALSSLKKMVTYHDELTQQSTKMLTLYQQNQGCEIFNNVLDDQWFTRYFSQDEARFWHHLTVDKLLNERNRHWMPVLLDKLPQKSLFIAVGTAHLYGENGLIALLQQQGYSVTPQ